MVCLTVKMEVREIPMLEGNFDTAAAAWKVFILRLASLANGTSFLFSHLFCAILYTPPSNTRKHHLGNHNHSNTQGRENL